MSVRASEVGLLRLVVQRLAGPPVATPVEAVRGLVAAQAQDLSHRGRLELDPFAPLPASTVAGARTAHARLPT